MENLNNDLIEVNNILFNRYLTLLDETDITFSFGEINNKYAIDFCQKAINTKMQEDKHSRWLGFAQGILIAAGILDTLKERDFSRELYQKVYEKYGIKQETISVS